VVSKDKLVEITSEEFYDHLLELDWLWPGNDTHSVLNPTYSKEALFLSVLFLNIDANAYNYLLEYFQEVEDMMLEPKVKA